MLDSLTIEPKTSQLEEGNRSDGHRNEPFSPEQTRSILENFRQEGCTLIPNILSQDKVHALRNAVDRVFADPRAKETHNIYGEFLAVRLFEQNNLFRDMLVMEPIISLMETLLGADCHLISNNVIRNRPGEAIANYHVDERLLFPLPESVERFDSRMTIPTFLLNVQIPLTDIEADEYGPTQYVPGSHYSGRHPNDKSDPVWEGKRGQSIFCKAGDIYLQDGQVWHRGAPNASNRTRYLLQMSFGTRMIAQRFYPFINYQMPKHVWDGASDRLRRVLGEHPKGPYG